MMTLIIDMKIITIMSATVFMVFIVSGCWLIHPDESAAGRSMLSAAAYVGNLKEEGKLPGVAKGENFKIQSVPIKAGWKQPEINSLMLQLTADNKPNTIFWYQVKRTGQDDPWQLVKAWTSHRDETNFTVIFPESPK